MHTKSFEPCSWAFLALLLVGCDSGVNPLGECSSSTGAGCASEEICVDDDTDGCHPDVDVGCDGFCVEPVHLATCAGPGSVPCPPELSCVPNPRTYLGTDPTGICVGAAAIGICGYDPPLPCPEGFLCLGGKIPVDGPGDCAPEHVSCAGPIVCKVVEPAACPTGYSHATLQGCWGPCVPTDTCSCATNAECPPGAACDRVNGHCAALPFGWVPLPACSLPFDSGPCDALIHVFAFVDGACVQQTYGGCQGNDNRFSTREECLLACQGRPDPYPCPGDRSAAEICLACGVAGGCAKSAAVCAKPCEREQDCSDEGALFACVDGWCQVSGCI